MLYFSLFILALFPSIIWLLYYLKKDTHPEPKLSILYVFFAGIFFAVIGYFFQKGAASLLFSFTALSSFFLFIFYFQKFIIVALSEEFFKYIAFAFTTSKQPELDEPVDVVFYMITAGLGFAALENIVLFFSLECDISQVAHIAFLRFVSATLLHPLASGIFGLFIIYGYRYMQKKIILFGLLFATIIHGIYNIIAERIEENYFFFFLLLFLFTLALTLSFGIKKVKKMRSVCLLK